MNRFHLETKFFSTLGYALVSTAILPNSTYETMLFRIRRCSVDYSEGIDETISHDEESARAAHQAMIRKWSA